MGAVDVEGERGVMIDLDIALRLGCDALSADNLANFKMVSVSLSRS